MIKLTEEQQVIVELCKGEHLVLAPPGMGKTELLAERLSNAIKKGVRQENMICLTFTNRAAANMLERTAKKIGEHKIFIGNLHSWCSEYLRKNKIVPQNVSLLDEEDSLLIIDELKDELKDEIYTGNITKEFRDRGELIKLNTFLKQKKLGFSDEILLPANLTDIGMMLYQEILVLCEKYEKIKKDSLFLDLDDLLTLSYSNLLKNKSNFCISWLQIDEVQDLNPLQWAIVNAITDKKNLIVFFLVIMNKRYSLLWGLNQIALMIFAKMVQNHIIYMIILDHHSIYWIYIINLQIAGLTLIGASLLLRIVN